MQDLQIHCQDIYYIEGIKLDPIKSRRRTYHSSVNVNGLPGASVKLEHHCALLRETWQAVSETVLFGLHSLKLIPSGSNSLAWIEKADQSMKGLRDLHPSPRLRARILAA